MPRQRHLKLISLAFFVAIISAFLLSDIVSQSVRGFSSGPPPERTGAPGERTCNSCHSGPDPTGLFTITAPSGYVPGQTYPITVTHTTEDKSRMKWGFQLTCLTGSNQRAGNLIEDESTIVLMGEKEFFDRQYIEHNAGSTFEGQFFGASWTFNWTAPAADEGTLTFYAAGNQADGGFTNADDQIYTTSRAMPPACVALSTSTQLFGVRGGSGVASVSAVLGCSWNVLNTAPDWIVLTSPEDGAGGGEVTFEVRDNATGSGRVATLIVGGRILTVAQDGGQTNCAYSISPTFNNFSSAGGTDSINVTATAGCVWQAVTNASWITITSASAGVGNTTLSYSVAPNPGPLARKGVIKIAGKTFSIKQQ
ncbi:MAG TPA: choice-of-anchor V domain-containing protein [Blastocatellia bacterium]|nr:choice-of-anchor V domain-containing protein [Blastocatellia bacterium]